MNKLKSGVAKGKGRPSMKLILLIQSMHRALSSSNHHPAGLYFSNFVFDAQQLYICQIMIKKPTLHFVSLPLY